MEAWPLPTLQAPDIVRQKGATSFMGSLSQSSLASLLPPKLMTKLRSENTFSCHQTRYVEAGPQKGRTGGEGGQRGKGKRQADGTSLAMKCQMMRNFKGKDAVVGKGQERPFEKSSEKALAAVNIRSRGFHRGSPSLPILRADLP